MRTIQDRGYVAKRGQALIPSFLAFAVIGLLEGHYPRLVDYNFTAAMENELDEIAGGDHAALDFLTAFYFGNDVAGNDSIAKAGGLKKMVTENLSAIDARSVNSIPLFVDDAGREVVVRVGRYGPYLQRDVPGAAPTHATEEDGSRSDGSPASGGEETSTSGGGDRVSIPEGVAPDELTPEKVDELFLGGGGERSLGNHPETGDPVLLRSGRYGPYVSSGDRNSSLLKTHTPDTLTLDDALRLLTLPRVVGVAPDGAEVLAAAGRYGPYVKKGDEFRSLDSEDKIFTVSLDEALALLAAPKTRQRRAAAPPLREMGVDPATEKPLVIKDGRFGPYVTDGEYNASLRRGQTPEELTIEQASEMLAEKRAKGPVAPRKKVAKKAATKKTASSSASASSSSSAEKAPAKKAAPKKAAAKKAAPRKATAKKAAPAVSTDTVDGAVPARKAPARKVTSNGATPTRTPATASAD
jgi:DNA topoisomerase-1